MNYLPFLKIELQKAGDTALGYFGKVRPTTKPGDNNQVLTEADIAIGKQLVSAIRLTYPDHNVIDEEAGAIDNGSNFTWVIDPIEATANFASGTPDWGIMVGLLHNSIPVAGGIVAPMHNKLYLAAKDKGATCNGNRIHVTAETNLAKTMISFSLGGHQDDSEQTFLECKMLANVLLAARNMRNTDCEAVDAMYVAAGSYGGRVNLTSKIWDNVAPQIISEESGALWTLIDGMPIDYSNPIGKLKQNFSFCVASPSLHAQLLALLKN